MEEDQRKTEQEAASAAAAEEIKEETAETKETAERKEEAKETKETKEETAKETEETEETKEEKKEETEKEPEAEETSEQEKKAERFGHKDKKAKKELEKKDEQIASLTDRLRRSVAEFDNYRKRTDKEKASMYGMGVRDTIEKILPVIDNFERGLDSIPEDQKEGPIAAGMEQIHKQFLTMLDEIGIKPIEAVGKEFDPNLHNAVMHVEDETVGENIIVQELQKGYTYKDLVVRHSMVKVAN